MRSHTPASTLSTATKKRPGPLQPRGRIARVLGVLDQGHALQVATGAVLGVEQERQRFVEQRTELGKNLNRAGVDQTTKTAVRELIDGRAAEAGQLGRATADRRTRWSARR